MATSSWTPQLLYEEQSPGTEKVDGFSNQRFFQTVDQEVDQNRVVKGWNPSLRYLHYHCWLDIFWGVCLAIFATGYIPIYYGLSQWGRRNPGSTNTIVTLVATTSTIHVRYTLQTMVEAFSQATCLTGFTMAEWKWLQGIREWSLISNVKPSGRKRYIWIFLYACMCVHSACIVAILQPVTYDVIQKRGNTIPCGIDPNLMVATPSPYLSSANQTIADRTAFAVGLQLGSYYDHISGNATDTGGGRASYTSPLGYGAVGVVWRSFQDVPGVYYDVQCDGQGVIVQDDAWQYGLPNLEVPTWSNGTWANTPSNSSALQSFQSTVTSTDAYSALFGVVAANGSGSVANWVSPGNDPTTDQATGIYCGWQAQPVIAHIQLIASVARPIGHSTADVMPEFVARAVAQTVEGIVAAAGHGYGMLPPDQFEADTQVSSTPGVYWVKDPAKPNDMLSGLLADGTKSYINAALTFYTGPRDCNADDRDNIEHWKFGNSHGLGWIAIVFTLFVGVSGVFLVRRKLVKMERMVDLKPMEIDNTFMLGATSQFTTIPRGAALSPRQPLRIYDGRVVSKPEA